MWTTRSPGCQPLEDVARDDPAHGLGTTDPDRAEELPVGDEGDAVRAADEAAVEAALDQRDGPGRRSRVEPADGGDRPTGLAQQLRQAGGLVGREDDPLAILGPGRDRVGQPAGPQPGDVGLAPAEQVARAEAAAGDRLGRLRLPGQLEGPATEQPGLPVARPEIGRRPILGQVARGDEVGPPLVGLPPQEGTCLGDVAGLVEDQQGARLEMIEPGRRADDAGPDLCRVTRIEGTGESRSRGGGGRTAATRPAPRCPRPGGRNGPGPRRAAPAAAAPLARGALELVGATPRDEELAGRQERGVRRRTDGPLVGRVEATERVDLVAKEVDPDRQRLAGREDVDDAAAPGELAATGDLGGRLIAQVEQLAEQRIETDPGTGGERPRSRRQVGRIDRPLQERLDAGDQDPGPTRSPGGERRDPGGRLVGDELAPLVGQRGPRLEDGDGVGVAQPGPELLGDSIADLRVAGDPDQSLPAVDQSQRGSEVALRAVRNVGQAGVPAMLRKHTLGPAETLPQRAERAGRGEQRRHDRQVRQATPGPRRQGGWPSGGSPRPGVARPGIVASTVRPSGASATSRVAVALGVLGSVALGSFGAFNVLDLAIDLGDVEVDGFLRRDLVASHELVGQALPEPPLGTALAAQGRGGHSCSSLAGRRRRQPVCVRRTPSGPGGPSTSPGGAPRSASAGRSWKLL